MRYFLKVELDESYAVSYHAYKAFTFVQPVDVTGEEFMVIRLNMQFVSQFRSAAGK